MREGRGTIGEGRKRLVLMLSDQDIVWKALISLLQRLVDQQDIGFENAKPMQDFVVTSLQILRALIHLPTGDHPEEVINRFWAAYIAGESPSAQGVERRQGKMSDLGAAALATRLCHTHSFAAREAFGLLGDIVENNPKALNDLFQHFSESKESVFFVAVRDQLRQGLEDMKGHTRFLKRLDEQKQAIKAAKQTQDGPSSTKNTVSSAHSTMSTIRGLNEQEEEPDGDPSDSPERLQFTESAAIVDVLRVLTLLSSDVDMQNLLLHQAGSDKTVDVMGEVVQYLVSLEHMLPTAVSMRNARPLIVATKALHTIDAMVQGLNLISCNHLMQSSCFDMMNRLFMDLKYEGSDSMFDYKVNLRTAMTTIIRTVVRGMPLEDKALIDAFVNSGFSFETFVQQFKEQYETHQTMSLETKNAVNTKAHARWNSLKLGAGIKEKNEPFPKALLSKVE